MNARCLAIAFAIAHMEGAFSLNSLGYQNNNPGDLEHWGQLPRNGNFVRFPNMSAGCQALYQDVLANVGKPLSQFVNKYAPPSENDTGVYVQYVSRWTGILANEAI